MKFYLRSILALSLICFGATGATHADMADTMPDMSGPSAEIDGAVQKARATVDAQNALAGAGQSSSEGEVKKTTYFDPELSYTPPVVKPKPANPDENAMNQPVVANTLNNLYPNRVHTFTPDANVVEFVQLDDPNNGDSIPAK